MVFLYKRKTCQQTHNYYFTSDLTTALAALVVENCLERMDKFLAAAILNSL
jgi:hypothetical protein